MLFVTKTLRDFNLLYVVTWKVNCKNKFGKKMYFCTKVCIRKVIIRRVCQFLVFVNFKVLINVLGVKSKSCDLISHRKKSLYHKNINKIFWKTIAGSVEKLVEISEKCWFLLKVSEILMFWMFWHCVIHLCYLQWLEKINLEKNVLSKYAKKKF